MDIIFHIDHLRQRVTADFCALDETSLLTPPSGGLSGGFSATFAIRFYAWTACLFADDSLRGTAARQYPAEQFFGRIVRALSPVLPDARTLEDAIRLVEPVLLGLVNEQAADPVILCAVHHILATCGRARVGELAASLALSPQQLERRFDAAMGLSPKALSSLMRYQLLWQDLLRSPRFSVLDAVDRYGYTDQAHLLHDFRRRHLMSPRQALLLAHQKALPLEELSAPAD